jgi:integrase
MINPDRFTVSFRWHLAKSPVPRVRFQDLRHGHVTHLSALGVSIKAISQRVNHSTAAFTMDYYAHVLPATKQESAELLDKSIFRNTRAKREGF